MSEQIIVAVDAVGGDIGPSVVLPGVESALNADENLIVLLCGPAEVVEPFAASHERCEAVACSQIITMEEHPASAVRQKKDSSIVVGSRLVKEGRAQGFFSAGSTGACLAAATLFTGRIKGVLRPALATVVPSPVRPMVMCDVGANADCKPVYLLQFAKMASVYAELMLDRPNPQVGLLNIGAESTKGSAFVQETYELLSDGLPNFAGNAESNCLLDGKFDVVVTDGFTGNVCLKAIEGIAKTLLGSVKEIMTKNLVTKLGALTMKGGLTDLKNLMSADTYGGAPLLGVKGVCMVGHGSSNEKAIESGVLTTARAIRMDLTGAIERTIGAIEQEGGETA